MYIFIKIEIEAKEYISMSNKKKLSTCLSSFYFTISYYMVVIIDLYYAVN